MPKIQKTKQGLFVYLPKEYMQLLNWNKGDTLAIFPDRSAKQTLVMQKTLDATSKEIIQSVNATKEAEPVKIQLIQPRPTQPTQQPRPINPINSQQITRPTQHNTTQTYGSAERLKQLMQQRQQGQ